MDTSCTVLRCKGACWLLLGCNVIAGILGMGPSLCIHHSGNPGNGTIVILILSLPSPPPGLDKWFPLTPISRDDEVQGEILVEFSLEYFTEVRNE
jgi:hypothetical protein